MQTLHIGVREFREKLSEYLLKAEKPVAITRHGDTVGYYIPTRRKASGEEIHSLKEASNHLQKLLDEKGLTEDELVEDFKRLRSAKSRA